MILSNEVEQQELIVVHKYRNNHEIIVPIKSLMEIAYMQIQDEAYGQTSKERQ
jgi:hypothetical protein